MSAEIDYDYNIYRNNTIDRIEGLISEEESEISTTPNMLSYSEELIKGSGHNHVDFTHPT